MFKGLSDNTISLPVNVMKHQNIVGFKEFIFVKMGKEFVILAK